MEIVLWIFLGCAAYVIYDVVFTRLIKKWMTWNGERKQGWASNALTELFCAVVVWKVFASFVILAFIIYMIILWWPVL